MQYSAFGNQNTQSNNQPVQKYSAFGSNISKNTTPSISNQQSITQPQQPQNIFQQIDTAGNNAINNSILGTIGKGVAGAIKSVVDFIPQAPTAAKAAITNPAETIAGAGESTLTTFSSLAGLAQQGIVSAYNSATGSQIAIPDRWNIAKQTQALPQLDDQLLANSGVDQKTAFGVGRFLGTMLPYALGSEAVGASVGEKLLVPTAEKFLPGAVKFVPAINNAISFLGIGQITHSPDSGSRVDQFRNDLINLAMFETGGLAIKGLTGGTKGLISDAVDGVKNKETVDMAAVEPTVQAAKDAIKTDTGKPLEVHAVEQMATGDVPKSTTTSNEVVNRPISDLVTHESAPDTTTIDKYKAEIQAGGKPPLVVTQEGSKWGVEDGKHKLEAYKQLGITEVPTIDKTAVSPARQQLQDLKTTVTPDDKTLNPIIDQVNGIIREDEKNSSNISSQTSQDQVTQNSNGKVTENSQQSQSTSIPSQGAKDTGSSGRESVRESVTKSESTINTNTESNNNTLRNGEGLTSTAKSKLSSDIEQRLNTEFKDVPGYEKMNMKDQANQATDLISKDPELAKKIAMGEENASGNLKNGSVFTAVREKAFQEGDVATLHDLAKTNLAGEAGQALKAYDTFSPTDPVAAIKQVIDARVKALGKTVDQATTETVKDIQNQLDKIKPNKADIAKFIKSIQC